MVQRSLAQVFDFREPAERPSTTYMAGLVACIIILSLHLAMVALPDRYYDALASHLYIASYVSAHRAWGFDAANYAFAYTPIGADMLYALMFLLQGETAARLLNFSAFLFTGAAVFQVANKNGSREAAIWTVVLFVSIPMMLIESATLFVEHTVTLFVMTAVAVLVLSKFRGNVVTHLMIMLLLAGATMVKLHGALAALLIAPVAIAACFRENISAEVAKRIFVLTGLVAVVAVWPYLYSWVHTGNPVFPLFNNIFKSPYFASVEFVDSRWIGKLSIFLPYRMTFASSDYVEAYDGAIGFSLLIFFAAGFAAAIIDRNSIALFCGGLACLLIILLVFKTQYLRYLVILFPLLMVAVGFGLDRMARLNYLRKPLAALVGVVTLLNVYKMPAGGWILGVSDLRACCDESYRRQLELDQAPERVVNRIINEIAGVNSRVFYVGNPFGALLSGTAIYSNWYNTRFSSALGMISSGPEFASLIERIAPTYIVIDTSSPGRLEALATEYAKQKGALVSQVGRLALYHL
jgi:4-amino-4-deoxy-L-arabinose transferase-like glycosyltransferase